MKKIRILSIDGGGIRGVLPAVIIREIENRLSEKTGKKEYIADYFDLIAGTSTGGILTACYLTPNEHQRPKFSAADAVQLYLNKGKEIFKKNKLKNILSLFSVLDEKYDAKNLECILNDYFEDKTIKDFIKPSIITSYDIEKRKVMIHSQTNAQNKKCSNFKIKDIARATSAAPTYFEPALINNEDNNRFALIDGGVFASNPAMCGYSEARTIDFKKELNDTSKPSFPSAKNMFIVSVGTGTIEKKYTYQKMKKAGLAKWVKPVIDIMMTANADTVDYHLKQIYNTLNNEDQKHYLRLEPTLEKSSPKMDDVSEKNLKNLELDALNYVYKNETKINYIVENLFKNHIDKINTSTLFA
jgi:uncharacterized protein